MGLFQRIKDDRRRSKATEIKQEIANQLTFNPLCSDYENVFAQVQPLINDMKMVHPFGVGKNGGKLPLARTPELALLDTPNDEMGWSEFAGLMFATWLTEDELNIHVHKNGRRVLGYTIIPPGSKVYEANGEWHFQVNTTDGIAILGRDEVMTLRFSRSPRNIQRGVSPATAVRAWAQAEDVLAQYERAYIENGAIPASITFIRASSRDKYEQAKNELEKNLRGAKNHGKTVYVWRQFNNDSGESLDQVEVKTIQGNNSTLAIKELTDIINDHLNKSFGVSNFILGDDSSAKYDNAELSDYQFIKRRVYPALVGFWDQFQFELDRIVEGLGYAIQFELELPDLTERSKVKAETEKIKEETYKIRVETLTAMINSGASVNSALKALNLGSEWAGVAGGIYNKALTEQSTTKQTFSQKANIIPPILKEQQAECAVKACGCKHSQNSVNAQDELPPMSKDEKKIYDILVAMAERIFANSPNIDADGVIEQINDILTNQAQLGAVDGSERVVRLLKDEKVVAELKNNIKTLEVSGTLKDRIGKRTTELVNNYGVTSKALMESVLANSEGKSAAEIRKALKDIMPRWQAERIARTETVYAFKSGRLDEDQRIADKYGLKMKLKWRARPGACDICAAMDGEETVVGEAFADSKDGVFWEHSQWNDDGRIPQPHANCRCYFDEILEEA